MSLPAVSRVFARVAVATVMAATAGTVASFAVPTAAYASSNATMESQFVAKMNAAREAAGLHPYAVASDLTTIAREHSQQMADKQTLYHNPDLTTQVQNWQAVGENVGEGPTVDDIHQAFMHSPEHRANILDHDFTQVGVGVTVDSHGIVWVTEDFRQPMHATSTTSRSTSSPTPTRHAAPQPTTTAPATVSAQPTAAAAPSRPHVALSPRARLLARLTRLRAARPAVPAVDPVAGAFDYVSSLSSLAG